MIKRILVGGISAILGSVLCFIILNVWSGAGNIKRTSISKISHKQLLGTNVPPVYHLKNLNGQTFSTDTLQAGKVLLVVFLTTCEICKKDLQMLKAEEPSFSDSISSYAISAEPVGKLLEASSNEATSLHILHDEKGEMLRAFNITAVPTKILLRNGVVEKIAIGNFRKREDIIHFLKD